MKKTLTVLVFIFSIFAFSQNNTNTKNEKIKQLMTLTGAGINGVTAVNNMIESFKKAVPNIDNAFWEEFRKEIKPETLEKLIIPIYDKYYTESEIDELIKFYNTPVGKKTTSIMPSILTESMEAGRKWGEEIGERALKRLKEKGLIEQ